MGLSDTSIEILEGATFSTNNTLTDEQNNTLTLAATVVMTGTIKSDFSAAPTVYATFKLGAIDRANALLGYGLSKADASTYVQLAETENAFDNDTQRIVQFGIYDVTIQETTGAEAITGLSQTDKQFVIAGDFSRLADGGSVLTVAASTGNDGTYSSLGAFYDSGADTTTIAVDEAIPDGTVDGTIVMVRDTRIQQGDSFASREVTT